MSVFHKVDCSFYCVWIHHAFVELSIIESFPQTSINARWMSFSPASCKEQEERDVQIAAL